MAPSSSSSSSLVSWSKAMEGISLQCEDCDEVLDSVREACFHEDFYSHTVEPILNLSCTTCNKHFRSKNEKDSHTNSTQHVNFTHRTSPKPNSNSDETHKEEEMIDPVEAKLIPELEALGLSTDISKRAFRYSGSGTVKGAVEWIMMNARYVDIDQMPLVPQCNKDYFLGPPLFDGEIDFDPQESSEEEDDRVEVEKLKKRICMGGKAEKEEEERAQKKNRLKLEENKPFVQPRPVSKADAMRNSLRSLRQNHKDEDSEVKRAFETLISCVSNVARNPDEEKFRKIPLSNLLSQDRVGIFKEGIEFLELCGFGKIEDGEFLFLARDKVDVVVLNLAGSALYSALVRF